jgi:hypothetical protein
MATYAWIDSETVPIWLTYKPEQISVNISGQLSAPRSERTCLQEEAVTGLLLYGSLDTDRVSDGQIVTNDLDTAVCSEVRPSLPVILVEGVFNRDDGVLLDVAEVEVGQLLAGDPLGWVRVGVLEVKIVLAILVEFG